METLYFAKSDEVFVKKLEEELKGGKTQARPASNQPVFAKGESIAVKLHMGERKNHNHLKPEFVKIVVDVLKAIGAKPFLFDSPVMYISERHTVEGYEKQNKELGFTEQAIGCPVVVSNDFVEARGRHIKKYQVCRHLAEADGVLVLTHFTGHVCAGIGASIKNLGMGALTRESKKAIHDGAMPSQQLAGRCALCKKCLEVCPQKCITYSEGDGQDGQPCFNYDNCYGCSKCIQNCPQKCLKPKVDEFEVLLADGAGAALSKFKKAYFVNVLRSLTNRCDCQRADVKVIVPDIGFLMGRDIVAIDRAGLDIINRKAGKPVFDELWHKDAARQIAEAEKLGMGKSDYELKDA